MPEPWVTHVPLPYLWTSPAFPFPSSRTTRPSYLVARRYQHASSLELADEQYFAEFGQEPRGEAQYQRYYFPVADYPLLSNKSAYTKESVLDEDDD